MGKYNNSRNNIIPPISMQLQIKKLTSIVYDLNVLAVQLPIRIDIIDDRKNYSDEWLNENGFGHITVKKENDD